MSVAWMLLLTLAVAVEKLLPLSRFASTAIGAALTGLEVAVASDTLPMPWVAA
jgi:predicted metal-binding membrane protein